LKLAILKKDLEIRTAADAGPVTLSASIDGRNLQLLDKYRITSTPVNVTMVENNVVGAKAGPTRGVFDGWWLLLNPLPAGQHVIHFTSSLGNPTTGIPGTSTPFAMDVTYHLNVK
jgi:hypothetical protein